MAMILSFPKLRLRARYSFIRESQLRRKDRRTGAQGSEEDSFDRLEREGGKYFDLQRSVSRLGVSGVTDVVGDGSGMEPMGPRSSS